jgi:GTP cyclohydrolase II
MLARVMPRVAMASVRARVPVALGRTAGGPSDARAEVVTFDGLVDGLEHLACVWQPLTAVPLVRLHSECLTGDVFGSLRCDCGPQLDESMNALSQEGGILLYMRQEGRGIGLYNKLDAYLLQDDGFDTFAANRMLGRGEDEREYASAAQMLFALDVSKVQLITNNPEKIEQLERYGIEPRSVRPTKMHLNPYNRAYLRAKAELARHRLAAVGLGVSG